MHTFIPKAESTQHLGPRLQTEGKVPRELKLLQQIDFFLFLPIVVLLAIAYACGWPEGDATAAERGRATNSAAPWLHGFDVVLWPRYSRASTAERLMFFHVCMAAALRMSASAARMRLLGKEGILTQWTAKNMMARTCAMGSALELAKAWWPTLVWFIVVFIDPASFEPHRQRQENKRLRGWTVCGLCAVCALSFFIEAAEVSVNDRPARSQWIWRENELALNMVNLFTVAPFIYRAIGGCLLAVSALALHTCSTVPEQPRGVWAVWWKFSRGLVVILAMMLVKTYTSSLLPYACARLARETVVKYREVGIVAAGSIREVFSASRRGEEPNIEQAEERFEAFLKQREKVQLQAAALQVILFSTTVLYVVADLWSLSGVKSPASEVVGVRRLIFVFGTNAYLYVFFFLDISKTEARVLHDVRIAIAMNPGGALADNRKEWYAVVEGVLKSSRSFMFDILLGAGVWYPFVSTFIGLRPGSLMIEIEKILQRASRSGCP